MANGTHALALLPPASAPADATDNPDGGIKLTLGRLMADATEALGAGMADLDAGGRLTDTSRARGGETVAALVELQLATLGAFDFGAVALAAGRRALLERHAEKLCRQLGSDAGIDATFDMLLAHVLEVTAKVVAIERVFRAH